MTNSLWLDNLPLKSFPTLTKDLETDILVVGGGITGIVSAYLLADEGFKVTLVEANKLLHGTTGYTTGKVTIQQSLVYKNLINKIGFEKTQLYVDSHVQAMELINDNINELQINCDYETVTSYVYTECDKYVNNIEKEFASAQKLGINSFLTDKLNLPFYVRCALGFRNQGHFHVAKYLTPLIEELAKQDDCYIFENSKVVKVYEEDNLCHTILENDVKIKSRYVILASHYPCNDTYNFYFAKLKPSVTYLIAARFQQDFENADYINVEKPIRSIRTHPYENERIILIGGENHQCDHTGSEPIHYLNLEKFGRKYFGISDVLYRFSTQDYYTFDNIPYIGSINRDFPHIIVATGYKKWGMVTSHVAALLSRDIITNKQTPYESLYNPQRWRDKLSCQFFSYNLKSVGRLIGDRFKKMPKDFDVEKGMGKIVSYKGKKYGVYKDENGEVFIVDVVCPHLKCILTFNNEHKTYDCPCHGSRFTYKGKYLDGPSIKDLKRINFKDLK
ncbi:MAG TPA: FAD-dependent oxidoreductase [Haloplasmataceae bacterium]